MFDEGAVKKYSKDSKALIVSTYFKKDLGFSYKVKDALEDQIIIDPKFENVIDYTNKDFIQFAFKDTV